MKNFAAGLCFGLAFAVIGVWYAQGAHTATLSEEFVEETIVTKDGDCAEEFDPDFCIETKRVGRPVFKIGLMDFALPGVGLLFAAGAGLLFLSYRARSSN